MLHVFGPPLWGALLVLAVTPNAFAQKSSPVKDARDRYAATKASTGNATTTPQTRGVWKAPADLSNIKGKTGAGPSRRGRLIGGDYGQESKRKIAPAHSGKARKIDRDLHAPPPR